jgi:phosphocarrier protein HPr
MTRTAAAALTVVNELGLHARAATVLAQLAAGYASELYLSKDGREVNGRSIMSVLLLTATKGSVVEIRAVGDDAENLIAAVSRLFADKFGEPA